VLFADRGLGLRLNDLAGLFDDHRPRRVKVVLDRVELGDKTENGERVAHRLSAAYPQDASAGFSALVATCCARIHRAISWNGGRPFARGFWCNSSKCQQFCCIATRRLIPDCHRSVGARDPQHQLTLRLQGTAPRFCGTTVCGALSTLLFRSPQNRRALHLGM